jgi:hypothetical protein
MTNGLNKDRKTIFVNNYAVQWFKTPLKNTKILIYVKIPSHKYINLTELTLDYIADEVSVEMASREKIKEIESYE